MALKLSAERPIGADPMTSAPNPLDSQFHEQVPGERSTSKVAREYFGSLGAEIGTVDRMFDGPSASQREDGSRAFMSIRKEAGRQMFIQMARPQIERILSESGELRSFDEVVSIFGFNRLFMREVGSAGTDVDFFMLIDTDNQKIVDDIRALMKGEIAPELGRMGIDMETSDYLMIRMDEYEGKLSETHKALFTLANTGNVDFITGSRELVERAFTLSNEQLAHHFVNILVKNGHISEEGAAGVRERVLGKISESPDARREIVSLLRQMASSEIYIGKTPYKRKKTIQTELKKVSLEARTERTADVSIKFNFNRIADMYMTTPVDPRRELLSSNQVMALEKLSMVLSNIKCRVDDEEVHPLLKVQETYSNLSLSDIRKMSKEDREVVASLLEAFDLHVDPYSPSFSEECYDALWALSDQMGRVAVALEGGIFAKALAFVPEVQQPQEAQGISWTTIGVMGLIALGIGYFGMSKFK